MNANEKEAAKIDESYVKFVEERLKKTNYHAEEKLKNIDDLAEIIFTARDSYQKTKKA